MARFKPRPRHRRERPPAVVRWLGAFRSKTDPIRSALWEVSGHRQDVACEPLWQGAADSIRAMIGLRVDTSKSLLVAAYAFDAWTVREEDGSLRPTRRTDLFCQDWADLCWLGRERPRKGRRFHGEVIVRFPVYSAVVVHINATVRQRKLARKIADAVGLPLQEIR